MTHIVREVDRPGSKVNKKEIVEAVSRRLCALAGRRAAVLQIAPISAEILYIAKV